MRIPEFSMEAITKQPKNYGFLEAHINEISSIILYSNINKRFLGNSIQKQ